MERPSGTSALEWQWAVLVGLLLLAVSLIVGAIRDWDWLYDADREYHNNWSMGQISRYLGRGVARIIGFGGGLALLILAVVLGVGVVRNTLH